MVLTYTMLSPEEIVTHKPTVVCVNPVNIFRYEQCFYSDIDHTFFPDCRYL